jgi:hypothetical protein
MISFNKFTKQVATFHKLITWMQKIMKSKCETSNAKYEVLQSMWEKQIFIWFKKAI